ncbi:MAG: tRNA (adenosine(37)-N6)-threonylcarbamoyltransferase complex dimerization subunit type 1 TsaB [Burkholderiales bacterium]|nr:tRNA (adenosine(37)-N6)-threonylcarbamoyltransferase complex dimerization subunit type 1 TsaB [Burkholderiales bacterium]
MRVLALETSSETASVALWIDGDCRELSQSGARGHSDHLLAMVAQLMAEAQVGMAGLDGVACGIGPGAFTGVRIAVSVAQGLALARDLPVAPVVSLQALAEAADAARVYACIDARMGQVYAGAYEREADGWRTVVPPCLAETAAPPLPQGHWVAVGSGLKVLASSTLAGLDASDRRSDALPQARAVASLGVLGLRKGEGMDAAQAAPLYLRDKVALDVHEQAAKRAARQA